MEFEMKSGSWDRFSRETWFRDGYAGAAQASVLADCSGLPLRMPLTPRRALERLTLSRPSLTSFKRGHMANKVSCQLHQKDTQVWSEKEISFFLCILSVQSSDFPWAIPALLA